VLARGVRRGQRNTATLGVLNARADPCSPTNATTDRHGITLSSRLAAYPVLVQGPKRRSARYIDQELGELGRIA
jgi:hypothetical protein